MGGADTGRWDRMLVFGEVSRPEHFQAAPNKSLEPTLLSRILVRFALPLERLDSSLISLRQPQGSSAPVVRQHAKING